jgi:hypothetical protein
VYFICNDDIGLVAGGWSWLEKSTCQFAGIVHYATKQMKVLMKVKSEL